MNNHVKLIQASGRAMMVPASDVAIIRTIDATEKEAQPAAKSAVFVLIGGVAQHVMVRESFGWIMRKAGGNSGERITVAGPGETKVSIPRAAIVTAIEEPDINNDNRDITVISTSYHGPQGVVRILSVDSVESIMDDMGADVSDEEAEEDAGESEQPAPPRRRNRAGGGKKE